MCARRPTSAMPKPLLCCERAFCCSMVVMWPVLMHVMSFDVVVISFDAMWLLVLCHVTWCNAMSCDVRSCDVPCNGHVVCSKWFCDNVVIQSTILYYKVLLCTTKYYSSTTLYYTVLQRTTPLLLCTAKYYSSTTLYYKVLLQYYSVLQSTTPVLLCTTQYYNVLLHYYSVLQRTTPVLLCTAKYYSSITLYCKVLLQYYSVLQSTTPVLLCTTKYYSSTTLYYTVLQRTTPVLLCTTKYYSSTTLYCKVLLQYYSVLQSTTPVLLCTTKYYSSTTLHYKVLLQYYSVLHSTTTCYSSTTLYYKAAFMIDVRRIWNVIYNAWSNTSHPPTSRTTAPATQNDCDDWSASDMKRHLQWAEQQESQSIFTKYCTCHAKWMPAVIRVTYETSFPMRGASKVTLQTHQLLRLPRKMNLMIDPRHIWNVIYNARSNRVDASNFTKYCACHAKCISWLIRVSYETSFEPCSKPFYHVNAISRPYAFTLCNPYATTTGAYAGDYGQHNLTRPLRDGVSCRKMTPDCSASLRIPMSQGRYIQMCFFCPGICLKASRVTGFAVRGWRSCRRRCWRRLCSHGMGHAAFLPGLFAESAGPGRKSFFQASFWAGHNVSLERFLAGVLPCDFVDVASLRTCQSLRLQEAHFWEASLGSRFLAQKLASQIGFQDFKKLLLEAQEAASWSFQEAWFFGFQNWLLELASWNYKHI